MQLLVLGVILTGLYFWGQYHKDLPIILPAVVVSFLLAAALCVVTRPWTHEADLPSLLGAGFVLGTAFYAVWRRFLFKPKKGKKKL